MRVDEEIIKNDFEVGSHMHNFGHDRAKWLYNTDNLQFRFLKKLRILPLPFGSLRPSPEFDGFASCR